MGGVICRQACRGVARSGRSLSLRAAVLRLAPAGRDAPWGASRSPRAGSPRVATTWRERESSLKDLAQPWNWRTDAVSRRQRWRLQYNKRSIPKVCFLLVGMVCFGGAPWQGGAFQWVRVPPGDSLPPEAIGAVMEVSKRLKPSISGSRIGDRASVQAATRVNAEQASKRTMCRPTRRPLPGKADTAG